MSVRMTVVHVEAVSFQCSEATNLDRIIARAKLNLKTNEAAILFSLRGNQAIFVKRPEMVTLVAGHPRTLYMSARLRLSGGSWEQSLPEFFTACEHFGLDVSRLRERVIEFIEAKSGQKYEAPELKSPRRYPRRQANLQAVG